ncbi:MAG: bifunctional [glutamine synthetase] adenylyltransferase/[glutamine synthetase]-adenylyl-L-tyrosine phosphorylase [Alphaproteobacteria bacterium]|nr:bifunctional [glutamine synthetase] adenylyltransferase/[glutamine synthetase]-adenylyl-L-tyrosine phosphorylase [Alphaproteobacteria bacterium]
MYSSMNALLAHSPYLTQLATRYPDLMTRASGASAGELVRGECFALPEEPATQPELMKALREAKNKLALLVALADIRGEWSLEQVTGALSDFADMTLSHSLRFLLRAAEKRGEITLRHPENPSIESGIIILGMGKLGGFELNYSSDIDLIIFFEEETLTYTGRIGEQKFMNRLAQDLVTIMQERTRDGYVFRTDLRLRPDPASTPPAIGVRAAYNYYESVGQNWERAAMIKARPVAGDIAAGERFLHELTPYIWRRNLDFAAINDIHSIKRQMDARTERIIGMAGHNIKLGLGGIREIEFYTQIHQLIWGGRKPNLRTRGTCETLGVMVAEGLLDEATRKTLVDAYRFYRMVEHRLQMVADEQTHTMPSDEAGLENIARFCGYKEISLFEAELLVKLHVVHEIYSGSFKSAEELGDAGNLVFTGVSSDPETVKTLQQMGYKQAATICEIIMGWHHGSKRCTRTKRARELLTELMPALLSRLAETANPDAAFLKFDEFLTDLPSAIQLFSLFQANKELLGLIADIMGSAPALADTLAKSPQLIENVLFSDFYKALPDKTQLAQQAQERIAFARDTEETLDYLTYFKGERQFQAGVQFLRGMLDARQLGLFMTHLAEAVIAEVFGAIRSEFEKTYGRIEGAEFAIIALGKCGSFEMTFHSDLDMVFIYRVPDFETVSDGEKSYSASVYYNRFAQRLVNALSALNRGGQLYEVDTRLRPSGRQGLLAVSDKALSHYFSELAWTFETMAFTKARAVVGDRALAAWLDDFIRTQIEKPRDAGKLKTDVYDMRRRMAEEHQKKTLWDLKHVRGGLVDIEFIAQYVLLLHAPTHKHIPIGNSEEIFNWCRQYGLLEPARIEQLLAASRFMNHLFHLLRLCTAGKMDEAEAPQGLKKLLYESVGMPGFDALKEKLAGVEQGVKATYDSIVGK